ncbi:MAG: type I DNA topoisomerase [Bacteroidales bacterium]|nr:type I DNA topoisomerase [Bacteroidales bacterium]
MPASNLVIVESPAKAKTIQKFLGDDYVVMSSQGHVRDLADDKFSAELFGSYHPHYVVLEEKEAIVSNLKKAASKASMVWLASDEDREGEAIAWHLKEVLGLKDSQTRRIAFHEITKNAILEAVANPRPLNMDLVNAQQARRVLDRVVGFELSPVLWRKVRPRLSAGRVQSVTVRLVVEREREIQQFKPESFYRVSAEFLGADGSKSFTAVLKRRLTTIEEVRQLLETMSHATFTIESVETVPVRRTPPPPFTTSTLQQVAARQFGLSVSTTMRLAQALYESGQITYMRTDSVNLSSLALNTAKQTILERDGERYYHYRQYATKSKGAQEAHEAIRPTYLSNPTIKANAQEQRLYGLIWKRTIASQMADAELEKTTVTVSVDGTDDQFVATGEVMVFDGFLKVYVEHTEEDNENTQEVLLPKLSEKEALTLVASTAQEKFTSHPARYTEASLVRTLEELGIGRPSTYAPTISTIQERQYVAKTEINNAATDTHLFTLKEGKITETLQHNKGTVDKGKLSPTDIGTVTTQFLIDNFPEIMAYGFTAQVESEFDAIANGKSDWCENIRSFYTTFHPSVEKAADQQHANGERTLGTDPVTGKVVLARLAQYGSVVQIGATDDADKKFAKLPKDKKIETITLEEALDLFKLPAHLGLFEDKEVVVGDGPFGYYIRHNSKYISLPKGEDPLAVTLEHAVELIQANREAEKQRIVKTFEKHDIAIMNGRFGPYIKHDGNNYKIAKGVDVEKLTLSECQKIIAETEPSRRGKRQAAKKTVVKKTAATKKTATTKKSSAKATATKATKAKKTTAKATTKA